MNKLLLAALILFTGCVGTTEPHNPMTVTACETPAWWRATTVGVADADNPWNAQIPVPPPVKDWTDPWSDFQEPELFPKDFKPSNPPSFDERVKSLELQRENKLLRKVIKGLLTPKVEKTQQEKLRDLRKREKEFFDRSI
jgi:hypothetical protein